MIEMFARMQSAFHNTSLNMIGNKYSSDWLGRHSDGVPITQSNAQDSPPPGAQKVRAHDWSWTV
jgi:hypothetical protein